MILIVLSLSLPRILIWIFSEFDRTVCWRCAHNLAGQTEPDVGVEEEVGIKQEEREEVKSITKEERGVSYLSLFG